MGEIQGILSGLYSEHDSDVLYNKVKENKPKTILDLGPREGRTTSSIIKSIYDNYPDLPVKYYLFEKDKYYLDNITQYIKDNYAPPRTQLDVYFGNNIIDYNFNNIEKLDLLFIDALHDYILSKWYIDVLFPLVKPGGLIHIHDIYYNQFGNGWADVGMNINKMDHPDIMDPNVHKMLYPTIFEKYHIPGEVKIYEEDVVKEYILNNNDKYEVSGTAKDPKKNNDWFNNCSLWLKKL